MMNWTDLLSTKRLRREVGKSPPRVSLNAFHEDLDRILFSQPYRRLAAKTQVHPLSDNDHVRTRLTHSSEVSMIGLALGYMVGQEITKRGEIEGITAFDFGALLQAACTAHDIGNPPFGHEGEQAIRDWYDKNSKSIPSFETLSSAQMKDLLTFEGNAQGFRILTQIENYKNDGGMQLTYASLATFMKYPWSSDKDPTKKGKFGFFQSEKDYIIEIAGKIGLIKATSNQWKRHPLAYLVEAADDICYAVVDIEDGVAMGSLRVEDMLELFVPFLEESTKWKNEFENKLKDNGQRISYLRSKAITVLVHETVKLFLDNEKTLLNGQYGIRSLLDEVPHGNIVKNAKDMAKDKVFYHEKKLYLEIAAHEIIDGLLGAFTTACLKTAKSRRGIDEKLLKLMGVCRPIDSMGVYKKLLCVNDFISGMTDRFALGMYRQIKGISHGGMTPAPTSSR